MKNVFLKLMVSLMVAFMMASCASKKAVITTTATDLSSVSDAAYVKGVVANAPAFKELTAKMKLAVAYGNEKISVGGTLKMKKDEVIQLSLVAIGIVEAAKIEITPKRFVIVDRISRRYIDIPYSKLEFFADSKIDFYTLQALFWNELFLPGVKHVDNGDVNAFKVTRSGEQAVLDVRQNKKLSYAFLTNLVSGLLQESQAHVSSKYQMNWAYSDFLGLAGKQFPSRMNMTIKGTGKILNANFVFSKWDTKVNYEPVNISSKYRKIETNEILKHLLTL